MATTYTLGQAAIINRGAYSSSAVYKQLNTVSHRNGTFMCIAECSGVEPGAASNWRNYWVSTALGIYDIDVSVSGSNATMTFTLSDGSETEMTYAATAVADGAVVNASIGETISIAKGGTGATTVNGVLTNLGIPVPFAIAKGGTGANNAESARGNLGAQAQAVAYQMEIDGNGVDRTWTLTADANGTPISAVKTGSNIITAGDPATRAEYSSYGVALTNQGNGSLTFESDYEVPSDTSILINVLVFN